MPHIKGIGFENFRVFEKPVWFDFAPITVLTGPNNCGKSSINKALLLLRQFASKKTDSGYYKIDTVQFDDADLKFHNFELIKSKGTDIPKVAFSFEYDGRRIHLSYVPKKYGTGIIGEIDEIKINVGKKVIYDAKVFEPGSFEGEHALWKYKIDFSFLVKKLILFREKQINSNDNIGDQNNLFDINMPVLVEIFEDQLQLINQNPEYLKQTNVGPSVSANNFLSYFKEQEMMIFESLSNIHFQKYGYIRSEFNINTSTVLNQLSELYEYRDFLERICETIQNATCSDYMKKLLVKWDDRKNCYIPSDYFHYLIPQAINQQIKSIDEFINYAVFEPFKLIDEIFPKIEYLESQKAMPERFYNIANTNTILSRDIREMNTQNKIGFIKQGNSWERRFLKKWLQEFDIADDVEISIPDQNIGNYSINLIKQNEKFSISDVGFGSSQVLGIVIKSLKLIIENIEYDEYPSFFHHNSKTLIIEEPEVNLHPKLQSQLADFFVELIKKYKFNLIIETHSEYLIRKLQYLTAKKEIAPSDSVIYYLNSPKVVKETGVEQVVKIEIKEDGSLTDDFGPGFFDEAAQLVTNMIEARKYSMN